MSRDNDVYLTCTYGNLYAFNPDCTPKWVFETSASRASPAIGIDGTVYACTDTGRLLALDSDGNLLWETDEGIAIDSPVIDFDGTIYVHNSTTMRAIDPDGSIRWQYGGSTRPAISQDGSLVVRGNPYQYLSEVDKEGWGTTIHGIESGEIGIPSIGTDGTIYVGGFRDLLAIGSEGLEWDYELGSVGQQLAIGPDGTILAVNGSGQLYALLPDGTEKWKLNTSNQITSAASIDSAGTLYAGRYKAGVPSVAAYSSQGEIIWSYTANGYVKGAPVIGSNGVVYAACVSGHLYAFGPGGS